MHALREGVIACSVVLWLVAPSVVAQDSDSAVDTNSSVDAQEAPDTTVAESPEEKAPQIKFKPSEEVSEDLSIPFPVDI